MLKILDHGYLLFAIVCAVYSQCVVRWRLQLSDEIPEGLFLKIKFIMLFLLQPWVLSSVIATFFAGVFWIIALTRFELNYAYPWMAMIFVVMMCMGWLLFDESITPNKVIGTTLVVFGLIIIAKG